MNFGVVALLLLRLDARMGRWEDVAELAAHLDVSPAFAREHLEQLLADGMVRVQRDGDSGEIVSAMIDGVAACT